MYFKLISLLLILSFCTLNADEVTLKNGATLPGTITKITKGSITFQTDFAGEIIIQLSKVESFKTEKEANLEFDNRQTAVGLVKYHDGQALITPKKQVNEKDFKKSDTAPKKENETTKVDALEPILSTEDFKNLWPIGSKHPDYVKPLKLWNYTIDLNILKETGNTDEDEYEGGFKAKYEKDGTVFELFAAFDLGNKNGANTDEEYTGGFDYKTPISLDHMQAWYARYRWEKDRFDDLEARHTLAGGYSHYFLRDEKDITLRTRAGIAERVERYRENDSADNEKLAGDFQALFIKNFGQWGKFRTEALYAPVFEDPNEDYIYYLDISHELPFKLSETMTLSLKVGYNREYTSMPSDESEKADNEFYLKLLLNF
ncbi:DUF481 domain-containing protein [Lentisphaera marina]|uniref:DUF481 domain-containing protein n=1 Tax=Lentisphaera marina TaxID=1111041 RepID=UPI0023660DD2|nr:DUF481 domain-containing protein [Lentisphaera marina]MDD7984510.1 DUF481 domain-containing protein [Lentisphaera marina]